MQGYRWVEEVRSVPWRRVIFWLHLVTGVLAGLVIGVMSVTGVLLAFERQIIAFAERDIRTVQPPVSGRLRLTLDDLMTGARAAVPEGRRLDWLRPHLAARQRTQRQGQSSHV